MSKILTGKYFLHSFIVIDYEDVNQKGKLSIEFRLDGYMLRFDDRIFENRVNYRDYY
jgi:hypothetical protein